MKFPKELKRFCKTCKTHTEQKVKNEKNRGKNKTNHLTKFSKTRLRLKGIDIGTGNQGKLSRGSQKSWKRFNKKHSKKTDLRFSCVVCKKTNVSANSGFRTKKILVE